MAYDLIDNFNQRSIYGSPAGLPEAQAGASLPAASRAVSRAFENI